MARQLALLAICIGFLNAVDAVSEAHEISHSSGYSGHHGYSWGRYARDQAPPYFALHPPVYYSYPVPRTYGYSPYAYPPGVRTPNTPPVQPLIIKNPYVCQESRSGNLQPAGGRNPQGPIRIENQPILASEGGSGKTTGRFDLKIADRFSLIPPEK